ncbi:MAG TPA: hypothetical protein VGZ47_01825 [Gemmataceae bacterium]|jgi:hypothetical protein|nr:hypothetical protein [Gemmataceae bacterium]
MATLLFADLEMLRSALAGEVVPPPVTRSPAQGSVDSLGRVWLQPQGPLPNATMLGLRKLGVRLLDFEPDRPHPPIRCWQELVPLQPRSTSNENASPLLLEIPGESLPALAAELHRLGATSLEFRWWQAPQDWQAAGARDFSDFFDQHKYEAGPHGQAMLFMPAAVPPPAPLPDDNRVLVRVPSAPLVTRFRIAQGDLTAYVEQGPKVWVELGFAHPNGEQIVPPDGQIVLLRPNRPWAFLDDLPFCQEMAAFPLPPVEGHHSEVNLTAPAMKLPLKLEECADTQSPELWVIHERPMEQLADWVRGAEDSLLARFEFALAEPRGRQILLLRVKPSKQPPQVVVLTGMGCRPYLRLPNLFVPCGLRLAPALRRDVARQFLAPDEQRLHVLLPGNEGGIVPASVPESAFRPLLPAIEYCWQTPGRAWAAVAGQSPLECDDFEIGEEPAEPSESGAEPIVPEKRPTPRPQADAKPERLPESKTGLLRRVKQLFHPSSQTPSPPAEPKKDLEEAILQALPQDVAPRVRAKTPRSEPEHRRRALEKRLLESEGPGTRAERQTLWPELAALYTKLGQPADAALCWLNAIWEHDAPPAIWYRGWLQAEKLSGRLLFNETDLPAMVEATPSPALVRLLAAATVWLARQGLSEKLLPHAGDIHQILEMYEYWLPVRAAWLAQQALAGLSGGDELALQRTRDRLFERLGPRGLSLELDVPSFLRSADGDTGERFALARDWLPRLRESIQRWHGRLVRNRPPDYVSVAADTWPDQDGICTAAYIDLMLAWAMARLGEQTSCRHLRDKGREVLERFDDSEHRLLFRAFDKRIRQVFDGRGTTSALPPELLAELESWQAETADERLVLARYRVDALRQHSHILGASEEVVSAPHPELADHADPLGQAQQLEQEIHFAAQAGKHEIVAERITQLAQLFEAKEFQFVPLVRRLQRGTYSPAELRRFEHLPGKSLAALRRFGKLADVERFRVQSQEWILQGVPVGRLKASQPKTWLSALRALLHVDANGVGGNDNSSALAAVKLARQELLREQPLPVAERVELACAYVRALAQAPPQFVMKRIEELFHEIDGLYDVRQTNTHFALSPLVLVDSVVTAIADKDFTLGPTLRRWLDDDEFIIRRRLQNEVQPVSR